MEDVPRSGAPYHFDAVQRCEVLAIACDKPGNYGWTGQTLWTYDTLTETRTLTVQGLKPHKTQMWLHSPDPEIKEKVNDITNLYLSESDDVVICSIDEKPGMQAKERK